jgi:Transcription factor WhiB
MVNDKGWHRLAACASVDAEIFFPRSYSEQSMRRPLAICHACPVRRTCLADALADWQEYGVFGGLTPAERRRLTGKDRRGRASRGKQLTAHGTDGAVSRHRRAKEAMCDACATYERARNTARKRIAKEKRARQLVPA